MKDLHEALAGYPVIITVPLLWGNQDCFGHVNNTVYIRWCESARVEYLARVGMWPPLPPRGVGPILASITCNYKMPLTFPDTVHIGARVTRIGNSSFRMEHCIVSHRHDTVAALADSTVVTLDYASNKSVRVPQEIRDKIGKLEGSGVAVRR
jgi:acyl-CoA thioester hydrolase